MTSSEFSNGFRNVYDELEWRGSLFDSTPGTREALNQRKTHVYVGFDPTSESLHVGSLIPIMGLVRMQRHGHSPIVLVGGGTGMIGDPSGKAEERTLTTPERVDRNLRSIQAQLERFLDFDAKDNPAVMVNNAEWLRPALVIDFLRDIGKHFSINAMLGKESVKSRIEKGISFTEFSYQLLQAYDYMKLHERYGCTLQCGGSDQWGNIIAGVDLIRKTKQTKVHALVYPLITDSSGSKFGKSVGGVPTLNAERTSPYALYQFFVNTSDKDVVRYLKLFTLLDKAQIEQMEQAVNAEPEKRTAQKNLAKEITLMVHGQSGLNHALAQTMSIFGDKDGQDSPAHPTDEATDTLTVTRQQLNSIATLSALIGNAFGISVGEVKRLARQGGLYMNREAVSEEQLRLKPIPSSDLFPFDRGDNGGRMMLVGLGKKRFKYIAVLP